MSTNPDPPIAGDLVADPVPGQPVAQVADLSALVQRTVAPWPVSSSTGGLVDRLGRPFDAGLHLTRKDGTPAVNPKSGRLICLPNGKQTAPPPAPRDQNVKFLTHDPKEPATAADPVKNLTEDAAATSAPPQTPQEADEAATLNAEILVDLWQVGAALLFGSEAAAFAVDDLTNMKEDRRLLTSGKRWLVATQRTSPAASGLAHAIVGGRYLARAASSEKGKAHLLDLVGKLKAAWEGGRPPQQLDSFSTGEK